MASFRKRQLLLVGKISWTFGPANKDYSQPMSPPGEDTSSFAVFLQAGFPQSRSRCSRSAWLGICIISTGMVDRLCSLGSGRRSIVFARLAVGANATIMLGLPAEVLPLAWSIVFARLAADANATIMLGVPAEVLPFDMAHYKTDLTGTLVLSFFFHIIFTTWPKKSFQPRYSWDWSTVRSCDIMRDRLQSATRARDAQSRGSRRCWTEARYRTISHDQTVGSTSWISRL